MKTSAVLASMLFGSLAVAAPFDKRALAIKTEIVTETLVVYTTVWDDGDVPEATTTPAGYFYEQPKAPSSAAAKPTPAPPAPQPEQPKVSSAAPAPQAPTPAPAPAPAPSPSPAPVEQPKPVESPKPQEPAPAPAPAPSSAPAPAPAPSPSPAPPASNPGGSTGGAQFSDVDITIYDNTGGFGACGTALHDSDMIVALAQPAWGKSTYDVMTGAATNPWCGQKIKVEYQGNSIEATIMDMCPGCSGHDIDLSLSAWKALTGKDEKTRLKASWSKIN